MIRHLLFLPLATLLAGCISFSSNSTSPEPGYAAFCQGKEMQCRENCGNDGVQSFSCKAVPSEGMEYQCQCNKPGQRL